jgi:hypothetical protein
MGRWDGVCERCGGKARSGATVCRPCYEGNNMHPPCPTCGKPLSNRRCKQCRDCWVATRSGRPKCADCGTLLPLGSRSSTQRCWACHSANAHRRCVDCNVELPRTSQAMRCWACHLLRKQAAAGQKHCSRPGCEARHQAKGYCMRHYQQFVVKAKERREGINGPARQLVREQPCAVCGYSRMLSEPHRIIPGGPYEFGNLVPVCSRCHDEIERGLTPCPPPWRPV